MKLFSVIAGLWVLFFLVMTVLLAVYDPAALHPGLRLIR